MQANVHLFKTGQLDLLEFFRNWAFLILISFVIFAQFDLYPLKVISFNLSKYSSVNHWQKSKTYKL